MSQGDRRSWVGALTSRDGRASGPFARLTLSENGVLIEPNRWFGRILVTRVEYRWDEIERVVATGWFFRGVRFVIKEEWLHKTVFGCGRRARNQILEAVRLFAPEKLE